MTSDDPNNGCEGDYVAAGLRGKIELHKKLNSHVVLIMRSSMFNRSRSP